MSEETVVKRTVRGTVIGSKMDKTIVVRSERLVMHPRYKKYVKRFTKYYAHDEANDAKSGDVVEIRMARPLSKLKRWRLQEVLVRSPEGAGSA